MTGRCSRCGTGGQLLATPTATQTFNASCLELGPPCGGVAAITYSGYVSGPPVITAAALDGTLGPAWYGAFGGVVNGVIGCRYGFPRTSPETIRGCQPIASLTPSATPDHLADRLQSGSGRAPRELSCRARTADGVPTESVSRQPRCSCWQAAALLHVRLRSTGACSDGTVGRWSARPEHRCVHGDGDLTSAQMRSTPTLLLACPAS